MEAERNRLCPSGRCRPGSQLFGTVGSNGRVHYLGHPFPINDDFVSAARSDGPAEARFRFTEPCAQNRCRHWGGDECSLIGKLMDVDDLPKRDGPLPECGIRTGCVWFAQAKAEACRICPLVVHTQPTPES